MTSNDTIASGYRIAKLLLHRMVDDLTPADFHHAPVAGANSASWIVGHLTNTLRRAADHLGAANLPALPADFAARFTQTGKTAGDQSDLGDPAELVKLFDGCIDALTEAVKQVSAEKLASPPTFLVGLTANLAEELLFGSHHVALHVGQLSTIRRSLGKPPVA